MSISKLSEFFTVTANLGVLIGLAFLVIEIQQNTSMTQAQTRDAMTEKLMTWQLVLADNQELASIFSQGNQQKLERGTPEWLSYRMLIQSNFRMWENEWYQYQRGLFEESEFLPRTQRWINTVGENGGYKDVWELSRETYAPEFRAIINSYSDL